MGDENDESSSPDTTTPAAPPNSGLSVSTVLGDQADQQKQSGLDSVLNSSPELQDYHQQVTDQLAAFDSAIDSVKNGTAAASQPADQTQSKDYNPSGFPTPSILANPSKEMKTYTDANGSQYQDFNRTGWVLAPGPGGSPTYQYRIDARAPLSGAQANSNADTNDFFASHPQDGSQPAVTSRDVRWAALFRNGPATSKVAAALQQLGSTGATTANGASATRAVVKPIASAFPTPPSQFAPAPSSSAKPASILPFTKPISLSLRPVSTAKSVFASTFPEFPR